MELRKAAASELTRDSSEIARNAFRYAGGGNVEFSIEGERVPQVLVIRVKDRGRGIPNLQEILEGRYKSETGMGLGIIGAWVFFFQRADEFWAFIWAFFQGIFWPAFMVYELFHALVE